jgi:MFS family permease
MARKSDARGAWAVFAVLGAAFVMSQFFRALNGVLAKDLSADFGLSPAGLGLLTGIFFVAFGLTQIPMGVLLDRFGTRRSVSAALLIAVAGAVVYGLAASTPLLYLGRILQGVGFAGVLMGALLVFARWFPPDRFGTWMGRMIALGGVGGLLSTAPLAFIAATLGWRAACYGGAALTLAAAALVYVVARDAPPGHAVHARAPESWRQSLAGVYAVTRTPRLKPILAMCLVSYPINISLIGLWAPPYLMDAYGITREAAGSLLLAMAVSLIGANLLIGPLERRLDTRKWLSVGCALTVLTALGLLAAAPRLGLVPAVALLTLIGGASSYNVVLAGHARSLFPDRLAGRGMALVAIALMGGPALMQIVSGAIADQFPHDGAKLGLDGYRAVFAFFAAMIVASLAVYLPVPDARPSRGFVDMAAKPAGS